MLINNVYYRFSLWQAVVIKWLRRCVFHNNDSYFYCMAATQQNNPLHGITLQAMLEHLVTHLGWEEMDRRVRINCFHDNPSISSSLKFLRKTEWARKKVEALYLESMDA